MDEDAIYSLICDWFTDNKGMGYVAIAVDEIDDETGSEKPSSVATIDGHFDLRELAKHIMVCSLSSQHD